MNLTAKRFPKSHSISVEKRGETYFVIVVTQPVQLLYLNQFYV